MKGTVLDYAYKKKKIKFSELSTNINHNVLKLLKNIEEEEILQLSKKNNEFKFGENIHRPKNISPP